MGSSKKTFLKYIYLIILYINIYKVWCNQIEECEKYLKSRLDNKNEGLEVLKYLFKNGHPNISGGSNAEIERNSSNLDMNVEPDKFNKNQLNELKDNLSCYIDDIKKNVDVMIDRESDVIEQPGIKQKVPTIIEFCDIYAQSKYEWATANFGYWDRKDIDDNCRNTIKNFFQIEKIKLSRQETFNAIFRQILNHTSFYDDDILLEFKKSVEEGATIPKAVQTVLDVNIFCIYRYTDQFKHLISNKRIKLENNLDGTPNYTLAKRRVRSKRGTSSKQHQIIDE